MDNISEFERFLRLILRDRHKAPTRVLFPFIKQGESNQLRKKQNKNRQENQKITTDKEASLIGNVTSLF